MDNTNKNELEEKIDILENDILAADPSLLKVLLADKTTKRNIMWCTKDYEAYGPLYAEKEEIKAELITGEVTNIIQPRAAKPLEIQEQRIKKRAEVFTPSWVCNQQNNQVDEAWFGRADVFNVPDGISWSATKGKIEFFGKKTWKKYVDAKRLEITCGEAPYLVSRYDTTTGELIPIKERIGLFDRKMRIVNENCDTDVLWLKWSMRAVKSVFGYEFQGDSVLIARENLLYDYIDYYQDRFSEAPPISWLKKIANIIAWNIWQMDGLRCVVPYSCHDIEINNPQISLFGSSDILPTTLPCPGCTKGELFRHTGIYCRIFDWTNLKKSIPFIDVMKEGTSNGRV